MANINKANVTSGIAAAATELGIEGYIFLYFDGGKVVGVADIPISVVTPLIKDMLLEKLK